MVVGREFSFGKNFFFVFFFPFCVCECVCECVCGFDHSSRCLEMRRK